MKPYAIGGAAYHAEKTGLAHFVCASEACVALLGFRFADTAGFIMDAEQRGLIQAGGILMRAYAECHCAAFNARQPDSWYAGNMMHPA